MEVNNRTGHGDRRSRLKEKHSTLVATRAETLALYADLAQQRPFVADEDTEGSLQDFCQSLIDYTASAHFQLYRFIENNQERRQTVAALADRIYPEIVKTTDFILAFNDRYDVAVLDDRVDDLANDLSRLGEVLADRIQYEDELIQALMKGRRH
ncbi:MAG: sigma D regulator [Gammaproteobacteria bacterium]|nr:sigma D regulator [Gammaproteobacteria bacterium]